MGVERVLEQEARDYQGPVLIFDTARILANLRALGAALGDPGSVLLAVKSFPERSVLQAAANEGAGFEVSNEAEYRLLPEDLTGRLVSLNALTGCDPAPLLARGNQLCVHTQTFEPPPAPPSERLTYVARLDHTTLPVQAEAPGGWPSRFGAPWSDFAESAASFRSGGFTGVHFHNGSEANTPAFYRAAVERIAETARDHGIPLELINIGGGLHSIEPSALPSLLADLTGLAAPARLLIEPGNVLCRGAGWLICRVQSVRPFGGERYHVTVDASYECHTKWSIPRWEAPASLEAARLAHNVVPEPLGGFRSLVFTGATCFERDILGIFRVRQLAGELPLRPGDVIRFSNLNGYSYAWSTSFNGLAPVRLRLVGEEPSWG